VANARPSVKPLTRYAGESLPQDAAIAAANATGRCSIRHIVDAPTLVARRPSCTSGKMQDLNPFVVDPFCALTPFVPHVLIQKGDWCGSVSGLTPREARTEGAQLVRTLPSRLENWHVAGRKE
jgi:hypothetical protein